MNINTGSWIAISGIVIAALAHFGLVISPDLVGSTITDIVKVVGELATLYGIVHQFFLTKKVVSFAATNGIQGLKGI